jgi:hypothetical protein
MALSTGVWLALTPRNPYGGISGADHVRFLPGSSLLPEYRTGTASSSQKKQFAMKVDLHNETTPTIRRTFRTAGTACAIQILDLRVLDLSPLEFDDFLR